MLDGLPIKVNLVRRGMELGCTRCALCVRKLRKKSNTSLLLVSGTKSDNTYKKIITLMTDIV